MGLWKDEHVEPLTRITAFVKQHGGVPGIQLNHAGRKAGNARPWEGFGPLDRSKPVEGEEHWPVIAPSAVPYLEGWPVPQEMTKRDIANVISAFTKAAQRALAAGFEVIELHGAHGYLLHEFLSDVSNRRTDEYGGNLRNRLRFVLELTEACAASGPTRSRSFSACRQWTKAGGRSNTAPFSHVN
jgi:2,4-dienoyl-CoA reductase-like NADH-dependent reductase (Old Yellow Enzyme family)